MHAGKRYTTLEVLMWTRRNIYKLVFMGIVPVLFYYAWDVRWIALPWTVIALLGTATAFIIGFRNSQTYSRTWEARQIWGSILNLSRAWGVIARDFINNKELSQLLVYRHLAWLTALRYSMREVRGWETMNQAHNLEWQQKIFSVPEYESPLEDELEKFIEESELKYILKTRNKATQLLSLQSEEVKRLYESGELDNYRFLEMQAMIKDLYDVQGKTERIKNFPYPRQFATVNKFLVEIFNFLLPFCMLTEFDRLNDSVSGIMKGQMVLLVIPFSVLISWVFTSLDQVGESTENPFEGSANDVPISQICRVIEIDMREMLGEKNLPNPLVPKNHIVL